jgi:hypothetical protein
MLSRLERRNVTERHQTGLPGLLLDSKSWLTGNHRKVSGGKHDIYVATEGAYHGFPVTTLIDLLVGL